MLLSVKRVDIRVTCACTVLLCVASLVVEFPVFLAPRLVYVSQHGAG